MVKKILLMGAMFLGFVAESSAQLLWKVEGNGLKEASYIFGTHHVSTTDIIDSIAGFDAAFNSCTQLYGEIDMSNMDAMRNEMTQYMMLPKDSLLDELYSPEEYKMIDEVLKANLALDVNTVNTMKPAAIAAQLSLMLNTKLFKGFDPAKAIDAAMQKRAKDRGMIVSGLETPIYQVKLLFGEPFTKQAADLLKMLKNIDKMEQYAARLKDAYMKQDMDELYECINDPNFGATEEDLERLIFARNRNWVNQLNSVFQEPTFVVVGAGHLPGGQGLLNLLHEQGYNITPVK